jgi:hypothetical protein
MTTSSIVWAAASGPGALPHWRFTCPACGYVMGNSIDRSGLARDAATHSAKFCKGGAR